MTRTLIGSFVVGALALLYPAVGSAQTHVDVGVWTPGGGGHVAIGRGPVYYPDLYYGAPVYVPARPVYVAPRPDDRPDHRPYYSAPRPVYVVPGYRYDRGRYNGYNNGRAYGNYRNGRYDDRYDGRRGRRR